MKLTFLGLLILTTLAHGRSVVPDLVVTPPLNIFHKKNKITDDGDVLVRKVRFTKKGEFIYSNDTHLVQMDEFENFKKLAAPVFQMIPYDRNEDSARRGTAFSIGENLVLTNHHVLDPHFLNTSSCSDFRIKDNQGHLFPCKKVHFCSAEHDICLVEMNTITKKINRQRVELSLAQGPKLKLRLNYEFNSKSDLDEVTTAIGNSGGVGIHLSQGRGLRYSGSRLYFYAPITRGNSGGALLNSQGEVIGVVKLQSKLTLSDNPNLTYNIAATTDIVTSLIQEALKNDSVTLYKFNKALIE